MLSGPLMLLDEQNETRVSASEHGTADRRVEQKQEQKSTGVDAEGAPVSGRFFDCGFFTMGGGGFTCPDVGCWMLPSPVQVSGCRCSVTRWARIGLARRDKHGDSRSDRAIVDALRSCHAAHRLRARKRPTRRFEPGAER